MKCIQSHTHTKALETQVCMSLAKCDLMISRCFHFTFLKTQVYSSYTCLSEPSRGGIFNKKKSGNLLNLHAVKGNKLSKNLTFFLTMLFSLKAWQATGLAPLIDLIEYPRILETKFLHLTHKHHSSTNMAPKPWVMGSFFCARGVVQYSPNIMSHMI